MTKTTTAKARTECHAAPSVRLPPLGFHPAASHRRARVSAPGHRFAIETSGRSKVALGPLMSSGSGV